MTLYLLILILYSAFLISVGFWASRWVKEASSFFVADRALGTGLLFSTLLAANIGAGSTVGAAGLGYSFGWVAWWWVGSAGIGSLLLAFTVGPRLWAIAARKNFYTVGDYLEHRYDRRVRVVVAVLLWLGALAILAGQLIAFAWILQAVAKTPKWLGCLLGGFVVTLYFSAGGLRSVAWVNTFQLIVKAVGFVLAASFALSYAGGWDRLQQRLVGQLASPTEASSYFNFYGNGASAILGYLTLLAPSFLVSPGLLQKIYGAKNQSVVRLAVFLNALGLLMFAAIPAVLGMVALATFPHLENREMALPALMVSVLPLWLGGLLLIAVFSAEISSADAVLSMLATSFAKDLLKERFRPEMGEKELLMATRITSAVAGALGVVVAIMIPTVIAALQIFYGLLTTGLFVPLVFGLYWTRPDSRAALAAILVSVPGAVLLQFLTSGKGYGVLSPVALGILMAAASYVYVALCLSKPAVRNSWRIQE